MATEVMAQIKRPSKPSWTANSLRREQDDPNRGSLAKLSGWWIEMQKWRRRIRTACRRARILRRRRILWRQCKRERGSLWRMPLDLDRRYRLGNAGRHVRWQRICDSCDEEREEARRAITQGGDEMNEVIEVVEGSNGREMWGLCFERDA